MRHYDEQNICEDLVNDNLPVFNQNWVTNITSTYEPRHEKTVFLHMRKQRRRPASRLPRSWSAPLFSLHG